MRCSVLCRQERTDSVYYQEAEPAGVQLQSGVMAVLNIKVRLNGMKIREETKVRYLGLYQCT